MNAQSREEIESDPFAGPAVERSTCSTEAQRQLWLASRLGSEASCAFNESVSVALNGALDVDALRTALLDVLHRHEALRGTYGADGTLFVISEPNCDWEEFDWSASSPDQQESSWEELIAGEAEMPFDLTRGPLIRFRLVKRAPDQHHLVITSHHSVCDGWSQAVVLEDLGRAYSARVAAEPELEERPSFCEYARREWQETTALEHSRSMHYRTRCFQGDLPVLELPTDRPRGPRRSYASAREDFELDLEFARQIHEFSARHGASFFGAVLTAYQVLLARLSGQPDVIIGVLAAGQDVVGEDRLVGHCVKMLPMRAQLELDDGFAAAMRRVHARVVDIYQHHQVTFGALLKHLTISRDPARQPLTDFLFNVGRADSARLHFAGLEAHWFSNPRRYGNFDLCLNVVEHPDKVILEVQYNADLYDRETIHRWAEALESILDQGLREPEAPLTGMTLIGERDRALLAAGNETGIDGLERETITSLLERELAKSGDRAALCAGERSLTYRELHGRANQLSRALAKRGIGRGDVIALCLPRSAELLISLLGVLKAGAVYVPIDPELPSKRIAGILEDSGARLLISNGELGDGVGRNLDRLSPDPDGLLRFSSGELEDRVDPQDLAYVIYTSGSNGRPKGVEIPHSCVANLLRSMAESPGLAADEKLLAVAPASSDASVLELLLPLTVGGCVVLASSEEAADGSALASLLERHDISVMQATPDRLRLLLDSGWQGKGDLRLLCGGEALPLELARELLPRCGELWNLYGPTETTVWSSIHRVSNRPERISIGRPILNAQCYVLDSRMALVPPGVCGELYIGGAGVGRGYRGLPRLTRERFVPDPFASGSSESKPRLYRTGDLARWSSDGTLEWLGRDDLQVKIRGQRVEIGEVEVALAACEAIEQGVVVARRFGEDLRLVAYYVARDGDVDAPRLRRQLRGVLPECMVPQYFTQLDALPLTANGEVDRVALPQPEVPADTHGGRPRSALESRLHDAFCEVLGVERIARHADFFESGGHSLLAAQAITRMSRELDLQLPMSLLFEYPSIARLAAHLSSAEAASPAAQIEPRDKRETAPLSRMQERVWFSEQMTPGSKLFHLPTFWVLRGELDLPVLRRAVDEFVSRQTATRTVLKGQGDVAVQVVRDDCDFGLEYVDLRAFFESARRQELENQLRKDVDRPFDLSEGPLFRLKLYRIGDEEHVLFAMAHHAVWDGWSSDLLIRELGALYGAFCKGESSPLESLPIDYGDFAAWHLEFLESEELARQREYWRKQLAGDLPVLDLEPGRVRPVPMSHDSSTVPFSLCADEITALRKLAHEHHATLYMVMLAGFECALYSYTGHTDLVVGSPLRPRSWPETEDLVGPFVNVQVLRTPLTPEATFGGFLDAVRETCLGAFANPDLPFDELVRELGVSRDLGRTPIYQASFNFQDVRNRSSEFGRLRCDELEIPPAVTPTELSLWVTERQDDAVGGLEYATALYGREKAEELVDRYLRTLREIATTPQDSVAELVARVVGGGELRGRSRLGRRVLRLLGV